jgi:hypothetical protein
MMVSASSVQPRPGAAARNDHAQRAFTVSAAVIPGRKIAAPRVIQARRTPLRQGSVRPRLAIGAISEGAIGAPWHAPPRAAQLVDNVGRWCW